MDDERQETQEAAGPDQGQAEERPAAPGRGRGRRQAATPAWAAPVTHWLRFLGRGRPAEGFTPGETYQVIAWLGFTSGGNVQALVLDDAGGLRGVEGVQDRGLWEYVQQGG